MMSKHLHLYLVVIMTTLTLIFGAQADAVSPGEETFTFLCDEWAPFSYTDDNGKPTGYAVKILQAIQEELNIKENIEIYPWKRAYLVAQNKTNTLLFTIARTKEREDLFKWIGPIAPRDIYLWKLKQRADLTANDLEGIKKYVVGTVNGEASEQQLIASGFEKGKNIASVTQQSQVYKMLYMQRIDYMYELELSAIYGLKKIGLNPEDVEKVLLLAGDLEYYYAFSPSTSDLIVEQFRQALQKVKDDGTFDRIANKYRNATSN